MMDFSRHNLGKLQKEARSFPSKIRSLAFVFFLRLFVVFVAMCVIIGSYSAYGAVLGIISQSPDVDTIFETNKEFEKYSTFLFYADGEKMDRELSSAGANRVRVDIETLPLAVRNCFVAMEDERFYEHNGIDVRGIFRAAYSVLKERSLDYGASTITQQLLKNQVFQGGKEKSPIDKILRKVQEQYLAVQLEYRLDKDTILEYYLNTINLGNGAYGIEKAAQVYFGKSAAELTISEAAVLAPIAWSPTLANPLKDQDKNARRRLDCLKNLYDNNFCTPEQYQEALDDSEDVYIRIQMQNQIKIDSGTEYNSYFVDELITQVLKDLRAAGYSAVEANTLLYSGGLQIYTTQDRAAQSIMDGYFTDESNFPAVGKAGSYYQLSTQYALSIVGKSGIAQHYHLKDFVEYNNAHKDSNKLNYHTSSTTKAVLGIYTTDKDYLELKLDEFVEAKKKDFRSAHPDEEIASVQENRAISLGPQCAMVIMKPDTGEVIAQYGGRGEKVGNRVLNRASGTFRQAGSTFKVLASFMPGIDAAGMTLATTFDDSYYTYPGSGKAVINWYDQGSGNENYRGLQSIRIGVYDSLNIVAVRCIEKVGVHTSVEYLQRLGIKNIDTDPSDGVSDYNYAIALGGLSVGCSVLEMTAAYAAIANKGVYIEPRYYTVILDHDGNVLLNNDIHYTDVMKKTTAWLLTDAMVDTTEKGTAYACRFDRNLGIPVAGKTGTAHDYVDLWFVGFTPYYCAAIWSGFDDNLPQNGTGKYYFRTLWKNVMQDIHKLKGCKAANFVRPANITSADVCTKCGKLAVKGLCDKAEGGSCITNEKFAVGTVPKETCTCHEAVVICNESGCRATEFCPNTTEKIYLIKEESEQALEHGGTKDTKNILPKENDVPCSVHTHYVAPPPDDTPGN